MAIWIELHRHGATAHHPNMIFPEFAPCPLPLQPGRRQSEPNLLLDTNHGSATRTVEAEPRALEPPNASEGHDPSRTNHVEWPECLPKMLERRSTQPLPRPAKTPPPAPRPRPQHPKGPGGDRPRPLVPNQDQWLRSVGEASRAVVLHPTRPNDGDGCERTRRDLRLRGSTSPILPKCATLPGPG